MWTNGDAYCPYQHSLIIKGRYNFKQVKYEYRTITLSLFVEFMSCLEVFPIIIIMYISAIFVSTEILL